MTEIYYYFNKSGEEKNILERGKLVPLSLSKNKNALIKYLGKSGLKNADEHFENIYNKLYKPVLRTKYKNSGIYLSPINFLHFKNSYKGKFVIDYEMLWRHDGVVIIDREVKKLNTNIISEMKNIYTDDLVKKLYYKALHSRRLIFEYLPQIVVFTEEIPVSESMIILREKKEQLVEF